MKSLNQAAKRVMDTLTGGMSKVEDNKKIDNTDGTFMPVIVECIGQGEIGLIFSIAHYYQQNGDAMADPEMIFIKSVIDGNYYPVYFRQDGGFPVEQLAAVEWDSYTGSYSGYHPKMQADHVRFANQWMKNIKQQQLS